MNPAVRVRLTLLGALLVGAVAAATYGPLVTAFAQFRATCLSEAGGALPGGWCSVVVSYPNRLPGVIVLVLLVLVALVAALVVRWCLRPFDELVGAVERLGPTNLGYRFGWRGRRDVLGRLGQALDAMMDRIGAGYASQQRFAANASHELRTPLAVQRALIEVSLDGPLTPDQLELVAAQLLATNHRNERLIDGLLVLAEAEQSAITAVPVRLDELVTAAAETHRDRAAEAGIDLAVETVATTVLAERLLLERLVSNLIRNAIAYNLPHDGRIEVRVDGDAGVGAVVVTNTGPVVPADEVDGLFEPFRRGHGDRIDTGGGAGLGLTIVRAIATAHRAPITTRPGPDGGLSVRVELPTS